MEEAISFNDISSCKILIVDDVAVLRTLIQTCLMKAGYTHLHVAENGDQALEMVHSLNPDLIILDIVMPGTDGFEVCRQLRNSQEYKNIPILIQTGMEATQERAAVFEAGANDLISKPINVYELVARVKLQLQNLIMTRREKAYQERLENELNAARVVQEGLIPSAEAMEEIRNNVGIDLSSFWQASSELGGDLWGVKQIDDQRVGFYIVDFSGHGVASALNTFRFHTLINESDMPWSNPKSCLKKVNEHLAKVLSPEQFATIFWGVIDKESNKLTYASAASPPVIVGNYGDKASLRFLDTAGLPVGILASYEYENIELPFEENDFIFLYSDALIESPDENGVMWAEEGLMDRVVQAIDAGNRDLQAEIIRLFFKNVVLPVPDDLTVICFGR